MVVVAASVLGVPVADARPAFLAVVGVHVVAGLVAVLAGAGAARIRKASGWHPWVGRVYLGALGVVAATAAVLAVLRWPHDLHLLMLGGVAVGLAGMGWRARRRARPGWWRGHIVGMGGSYVVLLTAFYVDNGPRLPGWDRLPVAVLWVLPMLVGAPLIGWALLRHRRAVLTPARPVPPRMPELPAPPARRDRG